MIEHLNLKLFFFVSRYKRLKILETTQVIKIFQIRSIIAKIIILIDIKQNN